MLTLTRDWRSVETDFAVAVASIAEVRSHCLHCVVANYRIHCWLVAGEYELKRYHFVVAVAAVASVAMHCCCSWRVTAAKKSPKWASNGRAYSVKNHSMTASPVDQNMLMSCCC